MVLRARGGDPDAVARWYELEFPVVWRLCLGVLADGEAAEDLAQETMLHLRDRLDRWDPSRPYTTWRNRVVINRGRDRLRRDDARSRAEGRASSLRSSASLPDPSVAAQAEETRAILEECLASLPAREREVFVLRDLEQRSTAEVAEQLEIEVSSVRSLSTLARRRIREILERRAPGLALDTEAGS